MVFNSGMPEIEVLENIAEYSLKIRDVANTLITLYKLNPDGKLDPQIKSQIYYLKQHYDDLYLDYAYFLKKC